MFRKKLIQVFSLLSCFVLMALASLGFSSRIFGIDMRKNAGDTVPVSVSSGGSVIVNTTDVAGEISGYGGPVPVRIIIEDGTVSQIVALPNSETPKFFNKVLASGLTEKYIGLTVDEALSADVDAVSGATYSSEALIGNIRAGLSLAQGSGMTGNARSFPGDWKTICALVVILSGAILPLFVKSQRFRIIQLILNVAVLGLWCGTFVNYTMMLGFMSNGISVLVSIVPLLLLVVAFIYPLFGKYNHYCMWICPFGSLQELAGKCSRRKLRTGPKTVRILNSVREVLWAVLMLLMMTGLYTDWMGYELFTAFMFREASVGVIIAAGLFIILSVFVPRPYCRFVCPTGTLMKLSQNHRI